MESHSHRTALPANVRFWGYVKTDESCWLWQARTNKDGYGLFSLDGRTEYAHRVSWMLTFGPISDDSHVLHRCDNPPCVRPDHLFVGTHADNMLDREQKGRNGRRKLTVEQVLAIRSSTAPQRSIAEAYGVSQTQVRNIRTGKRWTWL